MDDLSPRLRAVCDLDVAEVREYSGRHEYDGRIQDLSPDGVRAGPGRAGRGGRGGHAAGRTRTTRRTWPRSRTRPGSCTATWSCTGATRCCTWASWTWPATTGTTPRRPSGTQARRAHLAAWPRSDRRRDGVAGPGQRAGRGRAGRTGSAGLAARHPGRRRPAERRPPPLAAHARLVAHIEQAAAERRPGRRAGRPALAAMMSSAEGMPVDLGGLSRAGRRRAGPADRPARRELRPRSTPAGRAAGGGPGTGPRPPRRRRGDRGGAALDRAGDRVHPRSTTWCPITTASAWSGWRRVAALGHGDDVPGRAGRAGRRRPGTTSPRRSSPGRSRSRGVAGGLQRHHAARHHRARGRARALLARPGASAGRRRGPADAALRARSSRAGRTTPRNCASRRGSAPTIRGSRSASGWRRWSGSPGWPARSACTRPG